MGLLRQPAGRADRVRDRLAQPARLPPRPRWFQVVVGSSAAESGSQILPLLGGLIISATAAGQIVSRTGRYRLLAAGALVTMAAGLLLLTNLRADTPIPLLWAWMFVAGIGVGPTFAVFTLIVQNNVRIDQLG